MIKYHTIPPSPKLQKHIRFYWFLESDQPYTHFGMADVCPELVFHYDGRFAEIHPDGSRELSFTAGVSAPSARTRTFEIERGFGMFGIYLYPHALNQLLQVPASEVADQMVDMPSLLGQEGKELEEQILGCADQQAMIQRIESFFFNQLAKAKKVQLPVFEALRHVMAADQAPRVKELANECGLSERQLERQFRQITGFTPKQFIRIARFQRATQYYGKNPMRLGDIALDCGYYDQSHFIHDFKQFSGVAPREFFSGDSPTTLWRD